MWWWIQMYLAAAFGAMLGFFTAALLHTAAEADKHCTR